MFKKLNKMKIGARLKKSFRQIILIFGILSALVVVIMLYTINNYGTILDNYAYPQGDIAMAMNESAEVRAASRGIVGYDSDSLIESMKEQHEQAVKSFEEYLEKIRPTMITKEGTACMDAIDKAWAEYKEVDAKVIEVGATTDTAKSLQAQQMMTDEAAPKYQALDDALQKLMALKISLGNAKRAQLRTVMIAALTIIIIVIAVSTIYSNSLSVAISKSIEKPLNELKDRFITFAEGDIDSPLPTVVSEDEIKELVNNGKAVFYIGFDPTADSLHVGHFMALCLMKRLQMAGNKPIALIGGGTAMIGDPSGRTDMRQMMTKETINHNVECFKKQMSRFIDFSDGKAMLVNNADWLLDLNYVELLREVGACFSVNNMLRAECYKQRMEKGLSFLEFNYMIMQSYDFYELYQKYGCNMQFGGNDQWSNMLGGTELIRRKLGPDADAYAMTITLLLNSEGKKMGKTQSGAVWLDPNKTSPFDFYQYWRNVADADVMKCIRMLTFLPLEEIDAMDSWEGSKLNEAKEILAFELTKLVHGEEEAQKAQEAARALFSNGGDSANMPTCEVSEEDLRDGAVDILALLVKSGLAGTRSEARRNVTQGGVTLDGEKVTDFKAAYTLDDFKGEGKVLKRGKKKFIKIVAE